MCRGHPSSPCKNHGWKRTFLLGWSLFWGHVNFRGGGGGGEIQMSHEKNSLTFHYTGWLVGILISWFIIIPFFNWVCHPLHTLNNQGSPFFNCSNGLQTASFSKSSDFLEANGWGPRIETPPAVGMEISCQFPSPSSKRKKHTFPVLKSKYIPL